MNRSPFLKFLTIALFGLGTFIGVAGLTLGVVAALYKDRFYPGIQVAGVDLSGQNEVDGKALLQKRLDQYLQHPVKVIFPDINKPLPDSPNQYADLEISTNASALGLYFPDKQAIDQAWAVGHQRQPVTWLINTLPIFFTGYATNFVYHINPSGVQTFIHTTVLPKIGTPQPARLVVKGADISIQPPQPGFEVDQDQLAKRLASSLESASDNDTSYLRAPVKEVDSPITPQTIRPLANALDALASSKIDLTAPDFSVTPSKEQLLTWITPVQDDKGVLSLALQKEQVAHYLASYPKLDQNKSLAAVITALSPLVASQSAPQSGQLSVSVVNKPVEVAITQPDSNTPGLFPGKYIEVNLRQQKMYLFIGNDLDKTFQVSSGKWSTPTPTGTFHIHTKTRTAWSAEFGLYMPYWQNFYNDTVAVGDYGIHGLPYWPNGYVEGESHIGIPVSHGCVRLGKGADVYVYNWTEDNTPVYIH